MSNTRQANSNRRGAKVKPSGAPALNLNPAALRAFCARHGILRGTIAARFNLLAAVQGSAEHWSAKSVSKALWADANDRPVSAALLGRIWEVANIVLLERETLA